MTVLSPTAQVALLTGAGIGSINIELVKALLQGGAVVVVTMFVRHEQRQKQLYKEMRSIYETYGSKGSKLYLPWANCSSQQDVVTTPTTWPILRQDGPNHLGSWSKCAPRASNGPDRLGLCAVL